jgi:hypothetical protein
LNVLPTSRLPTSSPQPGICHMDAILSLPQSVIGPSDGANPIWLQHPQIVRAHAVHLHLPGTQHTHPRCNTLGICCPTSQSPGPWLSCIAYPIIA